MRSLGVIKDKVVGKFLMKKGLIMDYILMRIYKFFLHGSVVSFNICVYLGAVRI